MKRILAAAFLLFASFGAHAQFFTGVSFDISWYNDGSTNSAGIDKKTNNAYGGTISPQFGYVFNPDLMVGSRFNFVFDKSYFTEIDEKTKADVKYVMGSIGWDVAPFTRYRIAKFGKDDWFSIWADLHAYFGMSYPRSVSEQGYITREFQKKYIYGIQAMPALGFRINEKSTLFINFAIMSLAYTGSKVLYDDKTEYSNNVVLFTGKLSGLMNALANDSMYGIKFGFVRTF